MKVDYNNMPSSGSRLKFAVRYRLNCIRTWMNFNIRFPNVSYDGFVRVMSGTTFRHDSDIKLGHNVQFGHDCRIDTSAMIGNNVLIASDVRLVGRHDHDISVPGQTIWNGSKLHDDPIVVEDDVWIGEGCIILGGTTIGKGSVVAAGSVVTKDVPACMIVAGNPARAIRPRFDDKEQENAHLAFLSK